MLIILLGFSTHTVFAQEESAATKAVPVHTSLGYDVTDTSLIPRSRMDQQRDFLANQYDFPAKPRNQWELGINVGSFTISGDVTSKNMVNAKNPGQSIGFGVHLRKAWGYIFSTRLQFMHGVASGFNWQSSVGYWNHDNPWTQKGYGVNPVFYNYKTNLDELSFQVIASLNNVKFHKARSKSNIYAIVGIGGALYASWVDALNSKNVPYNFTNILNKEYASDGSSAKKAKNIDLKNLFDGTYETRAERSENASWLSNNKTLRFVFTTGLGIQCKLGKKVSLSFEDKFTMANDDLLDGQRWQEFPLPTYGGSAMSSNNDSYNYLSVGLNIPVGRKAVAPLWWMNPLDYGYGELHHGHGTGDCDADADADGVSDCFDRCPDTPNGVGCDTHGCPIDTDGDGVPDFKDKQLITPTECQPTDADGVGTCPDPECCKGGGQGSVRSMQGCGGIAGGSFGFQASTTKLSTAIISSLSRLSVSMRSNPNCKVVMMGNGNASKMEQQRSWDRVSSIINFMVDKQGIDRERFIFQYGQNGNPNAVDFRSAGENEEGPSNMPPPFMNLRSRDQSK